MKKMDEMDRNIKLRSEELGFKGAVLALAIWTLYECWNKLFNSGSNNLLPSLILIAVLCVQRFYEMAIKRKMIAGDEEYKEPHKLLWVIISIVAVVAIILSIGSYLVATIN
mgnify:CR=1 FL=1